MNRRGFSLIEVMVALVIITIVALSLGRFVGNFSHVVATSTVRTSAVSVAQEQIDSIRTASSANVYPNLVSLFNGHVVTGFPGYPNMVRTTTVVRRTQNTPKKDYTVITVAVTEPTLGTAVNLSNVAAAP